jgi:DNA-binding transcriptional regulator GbsR (MarR family)
MRTGINPEKEKFVKLQYKLHRVIIPVYIPDDKNDYFKNLDKVFYSNINSLLKTIDVNQTNITIINNNSKQDITDYIDQLLQDKLIDKHVKHCTNYGKVYSILSEARGSYEDYITIADADVFFFNNWQNNVQTVFENFKSVGVVGLSPDPHMAFYCNNSLWFDSFFKIKKGCVINEKELELFEKGINKKDFFVTKKNNWKQKHYFIENQGLKVIVGASHFASTYKQELFMKLPFKKPIYVFPGGELTFIDTPIDKLGYHRISLPKAFVYHMGNTVYKNEKLDDLHNTILNKRVSIKSKKASIIPYKFKEYFIRVLRKFSSY